MSRPPPAFAVLRRLALAVPLALAGCAGPGNLGQGSTATANENVTAAPRPRRDVATPERLAAWSDVKRITRLLAQAPGDVFPGLATLVAQLDSLQHEVEVRGVFRFEAIDPEQVIARNPAFWRASFEIVPADPLPIVLAALVYLSAGQSGRANEFLRIVRAGPLLPDPLDRRLELHLDGSAEPNQLEIHRLLQSSGDDDATFREKVEALRLRFPDSAHVAHLLISVRAGESGVSLDPIGSYDAEAFQQMLVQNAEEIALITEQHPVAGLLFRTEPKLREKMRTALPIWQQSAELRFGLSPADFDALAELFRSSGLPVHALFARRLTASARGFGAPSDARFAEGVLPALLSPAAARQLLDELAEGEVAQLAFFTPEPPPQGKPEYPIHPALAESLERTRRRATYLLEAPDNPAGVMTDAYLLRAQVLRQLGQYEEAAADLSRAEVLEGITGRVAFAQFYQAFETRDVAAAERALEALRQNSDDAVETAAEEAFLAALKQDWRGAAAAFVRHSELEDDLERAGFSRLHGALSARLAGEALPADLAAAADEQDSGAWIQQLLKVLTQPGHRDALLKEAMAGITELDRAGRLCEAHFALAALTPAGSDETRAQLENCVRTGLADFIEYQLARLYLEQRYPEKWDSRRAPPPPDSDKPREHSPREFDETVPRTIAPA